MYIFIYVCLKELTAENWLTINSYLIAWLEFDYVPKCSYNNIGGS